LNAYEKSIKDLHINKICGKKSEGYLINLEDYEFIKRTICFDDLMEISEKCQLFQKLNELVILNILSKIKEIKPIIINNTEELIKLIKEKNEYILIDKNILDTIQIHHQKAYQFNVKYFILELTIGEKSIKFYNNKYILNEDSYNICNKYKTLTKLSRAMIEYYTFEKMIKANPKEIKEKGRVYLVNKNDIDEWKESTNYENIKINLLKDNYKFKYIEYEINNQLLMFYKNKKTIVKPIKSLNFKSNKELEDYIKENSLVIVNKNFYDLIIKEEGKEQKEENIYFTSTNDLKTIYIGRKEMKFHSNSNILYSIKESYIRIIFKIYYFQEELNNIIKKPIDENKKIKIGFVQKDWIQKLKSYLDYNYLRVLINSCEQINEYNYSSLSDDKIDNLINKILKDYKDSLDKEHRIVQLNFGKNKQLILNEKKIDKPKSKVLKYYNYFEVVSSDIIASLIILFNNYSSCFYDIKNCIIGNNKILIFFQDLKGNDYYEIGNINNNIFNAEYLLDFNPKIEFKKLSSILYENDFEDFIFNIYNNSLNNSFPINAYLDCFSYKINIEHNERNNNQTKDNNNKNKDNEVIDKVKNILLSIYLFEKKLNDKLKKSNDKMSDKKNLYFFKECYLINSKFLLEFKKLFLYEFIIQQINSQQKYIPGIEKSIIDNFFQLKYDCYSSILNDENNISYYFEIFDKLGKLNQKQIKIKNNDFSFYEDFNIINEEIYLFLNEFARINNKKIEAHKIFIIINNGKIIFMHSNSKLKYIMVHQKKENNSFEAEMIFHFFADNFLDDYFLKLNKQRIDNIIPDKLIDLIYNERDEIIGNLHLLKNYQNDLQKKDNYKKYIEILIMFYIENKKFMDLVGTKIEEIGGANEKELFLLNKLWIDEFKYIFEYETIFKIFDSNKNILLNNEDIKIKINQISNHLPNELKLYLNNLKEEIINKKLSNKNLYEIINYEFRSINYYSYFFPKCIVLTQKFLNLLLEKNFIIYDEKNKVKYLFGDNKIAVLVNIKNEEIMEIGNINEYNIFNSEIIIPRNKNLKTIYEIYKIKGMNYIRDLMKQNEIYSFENIKCLKIGKTFVKEMNIFNINSISEIFRTLLIILINQYKLLNLSNLIDENADITLEFDEAFLIDISFLCQFEYNKIRNLILRNKNIISKLKKYSSFKEEDLLNMIFKDIDLNILYEIDKNLKQIDMNNIDGNDFIKKPEKVIISKEKNINIYNYFIIVNISIMNILIQNLNIKERFNIAKYLSYKGKIFIMIDYENQYSLLLGSIINNENIFKLEYIFDFKNRQYLKNEIKEIIYNYYNYINELNNKHIYQSDYIFPIYNKDNNKKVGHCFKYNDNIKNNNYSDFHLNKELFKIVYLYINSKIVKEKLNNKKIMNFTPDNYCLINSKWLNNYKSFYNYNKIEEEINSNPNIQNIINEYLNEEKQNIQKLIYLIIKHLNPDIKKNVNQKNQNQNEYDVFPIVKQIQYNSKQINKIMIYDNFELLNRNLFKKLFGKNINLEKLFIESYMINNYIIINIPNKINENQVLSMIGVYKRFFQIKYVLIYEDKEKRNEHLQNVINKLNNYLNNLQFYENSSPIRDEKSNIIGTIILLKQDNNIKNNFDSCPHIGLKNFGLTSYINATLQCFCHIEKFVNYFKCCPQIDGNKNNLSSSFKLLIDKLWPNDLDSTTKYWAPEEFINKVSKMDKLLKGITANNLKYLIKFVILTLHKELNKKTEKNSKVSNLDQTNKNIIFQAFVKDFKRRNLSIISDLFYSVNYKITKCSKCNTLIYNYQLYFFLNFSLEEVYKYKNQCNNDINQFNNQSKFINNNTIINIYTCFDFYSKINSMTGENVMYCDICKTTCDCIICSFLVTGPEILILLFNYGKEAELNFKIYFEENLNLSNYIEYKNTGCNYKLIGIITYIKENNKSENFIAYCKDPINNEWYKYNDEIVKKVENFQNEVINSVVPYLLLYEKVGGV